MPKSAKQLNAEISGLLTRTGAEPYWPGGDGGGGSGRPRGGRSAVVKPHARTTATCTRCSQYHTTEEHERHAGARSRGPAKSARSTRRARSKVAKKKTTRKVRAKKMTAKTTRTTTKRTAKKRTARATPRKSSSAKSSLATLATRTTPSLASPGVASTREQMDRRGEAGDAALASLIKSTIPKIGPEGRFGRKVFISEIWKRLRSYDSMSLPEFKTQLLRLNRKGLIVLARADLVGAMDPAKVTASEITDRGSSFHFVLDPDATPGY